VPDATQVNRMFAGIAGRYDLANRALSLGLDCGWRKRLVGKVVGADPQRVVDLATGSGDVALALRRALDASVEVRGLDFCEPMLEQAREKAARAGLGDTLQFRTGDCLDLPLEDGSVDVLTIAFGLRNLEDRQRGLAEMRRVLHPDRGRLLVLEFTQPDAWFRPLYYMYLKLFMPVVSGLLTGRPGAYRYLACSIEAFPDKDSLAGEMLAAGFARVAHCGMAACSVAIHEACVAPAESSCVTAASRLANNVGG